MVASLLNDWFGFPDGSVLTNLVASFVWALPGWIVYRIVRSHLRRLHVKLDRLHHHLGVPDSESAADDRHGLHP